MYYPEVWTSQEAHNVDLLIVLIESSAGFKAPYFKEKVCYNKTRGEIKVAKYNQLI